MITQFGAAEVADNPFPTLDIAFDWRPRSCVGFFNVAFATRVCGEIRFDNVLTIWGELPTVTAAGLTEAARKLHEAQLFVANLVATANARGWIVAQSAEQPCLLFWSDRPADETVAVLRTLGVPDCDLSIVLTDEQCEQMLAAQPTATPAIPQQTDDRRDWRLTDATPSAN
jgi:hypothetical protein